MLTFHSLNSFSARILCSKKPNFLFFEQSSQVQSLSNPARIQFNSRGQAFRVARGIDCKESDPERVARSHHEFDPFRIRKISYQASVGVAQRSPTATNLNPSGIRNTET